MNNVKFVELSEVWRKNVQNYEVETNNTARELRMEEQGAMIYDKQRCKERHRIYLYIV